MDESGCNGRFEHFLYFLTRKQVREDPSRGLSKTQLRQALHVALDQASSVCSPSSLLLPLSVAPKFAVCEPQRVQICPSLCHSSDRLALPPSGGEGWGLCPGWMLLANFGRSENETLLSMPYMYCKTKDCNGNILTLLPCSSTLVHSQGQGLDLIQGVPSSTARGLLPGSNALLPPSRWNLPVLSGADC